MNELMCHEHWPRARGCPIYFAHSHVLAYLRLRSNGLVPIITLMLLGRRWPHEHLNPCPLLWLVGSGTRRGTALGSGKLALLLGKAVWPFLQPPPGLRRLRVGVILKIILYLCAAQGFQAGFGDSYEGGCASQCHKTQRKYSKKQKENDS